MKNFQQTPKARRIAMSKQKAAFAASKPSSFQPREAWSSKRTLGGVPQSVLEEKQLLAKWEPTAFSPMPRGYRRHRDRVMHGYYDNLPYPPFPI